MLAFGFKLAPRISERCPDFAKAVELWPGEIGNREGNDGGSRQKMKKKPEQRCPSRSVYGTEKKKEGGGGGWTRNNH